MNIAPIILALKEGWDHFLNSTDDTYLSVVAVNIEAFDPLFDYLKVIDIDSDDKTVDTGILKLQTELKDSLINSFYSIENDRSNGTAYGVHRHSRVAKFARINEHESLFFPDESAPWPTVSVYKLDRIQTSSIVLKSINFDHLLDEIPVFERIRKQWSLRQKKSIKDGDCNFLVDGVHPNRVLSCKNDGCSGQCRPSVVEVGGEMSVLKCSCGGHG